MRICIVRLSALGDVVMMLPLVRTLSLSYPDAEITWVIGKPFAPLFKGLEGITLIPMPKIGSVKDALQAKAVLKPYEFDVMIGAQASLSAHLLYSLIQAKRKIGYDRFRSKDFHGLFINERIPFYKEHTVEGFLRFAKALGADRISYDGSIPLEGIQAERPPYFVINPCSSKQAKDWRYANYLPVIEHVKRLYGWEPIVIGSAPDQAICEELSIKGGCVNLCGKTSLKEMAALLKQAQFLLSPDTGPLHIASALKTPAIGLFSPTSSLLTGPYFSKTQVIDKHEEALERFGSRREKKLGWNVRIYHKDAMDLITVDEVRQKIDQVLGRLP